MLEADSGFQAIKIADEALLKDQESPEWKESAVEEMHLS